MRTIVIGGTRFVGRAIVEELAAAGHELLIVHRGGTEPDDLAPAEHLHTDRARLGDHVGRLAEFRPDAVLDSWAMTREDATTTLSALSGDLRRLVLSSVDVYRAFGSLHADVQTDSLPLDEESRVREERFPYRGREIPRHDVDTDRYEKLDVEEEYLAVGATVCRLPFVCGEHDPMQREEFILRRVRAGRDRIPFGPGTWLGSRVYVRDAAVAVRLALESDAAAGEIFNLTEERTWPVRIWAERILAAAGSRAELVPVPEETLPEDIADWSTGRAQHLLVSSAKARSLLGWRQTDPDEAVRRSVAWHLDHPPSDTSEDFSADDAALVH